MTSIVIQNLGFLDKYCLLHIFNNTCHVSIIRKRVSVTITTQFVSNANLLFISNVRCIK